MMGQVSSKLRRGQSEHFWFCQGCDGLHPLPDGWTFNGNVDQPTFSPSFRHWGNRFSSYDERGVGVGEPIPWVCHYFVTDGKVAYCSDSTHKLAGQTIDMPDLPPHLRD
jgi:hypothetical protein